MSRAFAWTFFKKRGEPPLGPCGGPGLRFAAKIQALDTVLHMIDCLFSCSQLEKSALPWDRTIILCWAIAGNFPPNDLIFIFLPRPCSKQVPVDSKIVKVFYLVSPIWIQSNYFATFHSVAFLFSSLDWNWALIYAKIPISSAIKFLFINLNLSNLTLWNK